MVADPRSVSLALGPELAQCCGGRVEWRIETFDWRDLADLSPIVEAESEGRTSLKASTRSYGRVERMVEEDRREDETASLPASEGWTEPLGERARAVYLFGAGHVERALAPRRSRFAGSTRVARLFLLRTRRRMSR